MSFSLKNIRCELFFSETNGALQGLHFSGSDLLTDSVELFTLGLRLQNGDLKILSSGEFKTFSSKKQDASLEFLFSGHPEDENIRVRIKIHASEHFFQFRPEVDGIPKEIFLEWIDAPQVTVKKGGALFWPRTEGILIDKPELREKSGEYHILGFLDKSSGGYYPGICQMQFLSYQNGGRVIYFGAHDRGHGTKGVEFAPDGEGRIRLSLQTFCGGERNYVSPFDYVLGALDGDWMDACAVYREWIAGDPAMPERGAFPELVKESPVVMIYPVRGNGDDKGNMEGGNEYFPYEKGMGAVRKYADAFQSKMLPLLMHWEGTAPWAPPYVWPPFGGTEMLLSYAEQLHREGHYLGVYCSGTAWTQKSCIIDYSREAECEEKGLRKQMIRGPHGEINALICNGANSQRFGFDLCLTEEWSRETIRNEIRKLTEASIDYAQFFDQNLGGSYHPCYSAEHAHPPVPGAWQTNAMKSLLMECVEAVRSSGSDMILGCEAAAADAYLRELPFNDLRSCFVWSLGIPVPGYEFVFHEYTNNFMGNQCGIDYHIDCKASPENLLFRIGYAFSGGNLLSILLRDQNRIHWGWIAPWEMDSPDQDSAVTLIRNLNALRKTHSPFLLYGRMEKPLLKICGNRWTLHLRDRTEEFDSFFHTAWVAQDGVRAEFLTNFLPQKQRVSITVPSGTKMFIGERCYTGKMELTLEPLTAVCCIVAQK